MITITFDTFIDKLTFDSLITITFVDDFDTFIAKLTLLCIKSIQYLLIVCKISLSYYVSMQHHLCWYFWYFQWYTWLTNYQIFNFLYTFKGIYWLNFLSFTLHFNSQLNSHIYFTFRPSFTLHFNFHLRYISTFIYVTFRLSFTLHFNFHLRYISTFIYVTFQHSNSSIFFHLVDISILVVIHIHLYTYQYICIIYISIESSWGIHTLWVPP